ncbi:MAG TPA: tetratricopeptide repeat protein [Vicinamibacterales bacterium]|jgi:lipopolysaccharide biosynthesis regulator YciM|nr:tetratricopeptide repeat protein [Vicinamibacterales bacterium]
MGLQTAIAVLVTLLLGLAAGKAWERYKLQDGRWIDRRRARESPHYMLGLNFLVADQVDPAIEELTKAAQTAGDSLEIHLILGNLYREKGQVGRAIQEHQALLQRPNLRKLEHANVLLCLGLDYRAGGFVDRAVEAFSEVLRLDPGNEYALANLEKLYEEQHQWQEAHATRQKLEAAAPEGEKERHQRILAFLENALGLDAVNRGDAHGASGLFESAIELDSSNSPAYLHLGDVRFRGGDTAGAIAAWERLIQNSPDRAYLAFPRLEAAYTKMGDASKLPALCRRLIDENSQNWRARLALAGHLRSHGSPREALDVLFEALAINPHALALHQAIWETLSSLDLPQPLVQRYVDLTRESVFYVDPHICVRCRYRSTELLWQCPHCHEWDTFIEERIAPMKDADALA